MGIPSRFNASTTAVLAITLALNLSGCTKSSTPATDDASLTTQVQGRIASDPNLSGQSVEATVASGVVTLSGSVTSDTARTIAGGDAAQVNGVRTVINNLTVQVVAPTPAAATVKTPPPPPVKTQPVPKPTAKIAKVAAPPPPQPAPIVRNTPPPPPPVQAPVQQAQVQPPPPPPPPPMPVVHKITVPAGTTLPIRMTETLDSASTQTGDKFTGVIASDIVIEGVTVLPVGTPVTGHVDAAQDAAHFKGSSLLTISLVAINRKGEHIEIATDPFSKQGEGRGKNTVEKVGGGAAVGAILGGILGGGKGAAIGSIAGGGAGAGVQAVTHGQQVQIPSETIVRFKLAGQFTVSVRESGESGGSGAGLQNRQAQ